MTPLAWNCSPYDYGASLRLQDELRLGPAAAAILVRRGHTDPAEAREFLAAAVRTSATDLPGAGPACELVLGHAQKGSRILVFGDYDVDGVCSTAMMIRTLRALGADPVWQLPSRAEGYGLTLDAVERIAAYGTQLLVTVDCGVTSVEEVARAKELGMEVLVTDHHRPGPVLPDCPVVHPALGPDGQEAPAGELCAAGVVLKLSEALRARAGQDPAQAEEDLDLAGLATVCDMVALRGENRRIAREGLIALARTRKPGLRALMKVADLEPGDVDARSAGFRLGPRINAAGRLQRADAALELMLTDDEDRAQTVATELDGLNHDRRETEQRILHAAEAACAGQMSAAALVVAGEDWHPGVVGIVASRLVERFRRPAVVIALEGGSGRGSGRSIAPYDLHAGLSAASDHLLGYGGHRMAAGLQIEAAHVEDFRRALAAHAGAQLAPGDLVPVERVDAVIPGGALTLETAEELERLGPFGAGNPAPTLLVPAARIEHVTAMGEERKHARFSLVGGGARARGVAFRRSQRSLAAAGATPHDVAVSLERNRWNGAVEARVVLKSLSPARAGEVRDVGEGDFWEELAAELECDPGLWWALASGPPLSAPRSGRDRRGEGLAAGPPLSVRTVRDRRGEGLAGIAVDLLSGGEPVLMVVADVGRRRQGLEASLAGMAADGLAVASWTALARRPELAEPFTHLVVVDPPPVAEGLAVLTQGAGFAHLAWGAPEAEFALGCSRLELGLRSQLAALWRALGRQGGLAEADPEGVLRQGGLAGADPEGVLRGGGLAGADLEGVLRGGGLAGADLEGVLRGPGAHPRGGALAGRLLRVLAEVALIEVDVEAREVVVISTEQTSLERSQAFRAYAARLAAAERHLGATSAPLVAARAS